jgi:hypothetical protein
VESFPVTDNPKPIVHELMAMPFHTDREWHRLDNPTAPHFVGKCMVFCSDGVEREAIRYSDHTFQVRGLPLGIEPKAWRNL